MGSGNLGFGIRRGVDCLMSPALLSDHLPSIQACFGQSLAEAEELGQLGAGWRGGYRSFRAGHWTRLAHRGAQLPLSPRCAGQRSLREV